MQLPFERWINKQEICVEAKSLAKEAIICYKASAYRAALLFSYLSFQTVIKDRLLLAQKPDNFPEKLWNSLQSDLRDDDKWDQIVYDALKRKQPQELFVVSDNIRNQIDYWKDRRNDCAHSKNNQINYAHVETFWLFMESNLPKLVVNGSKEAIVNRILRHFNPSFTPLGKEFDDILKIIPHAVEVNEIVDFFLQIHNQFKSQDTYYPYNEYKIDFWNSCFQLGDVFVDKLIEFLKVDEIYNRELLLNILEKYPNQINYFHNDPQFIRNLWFSGLFQTTSKNLRIYTALLRNNLIPPQELDEANLRIMEQLDGEMPDEFEYRILAENSFFKVFKQFTFEEGKINDYYWSNANKDLFILYLENFDIDETVVKAISNCFNNVNHPWELRKVLYRFLREFPDKSKKFIEICKANQWNVPNVLYMK